jgi:YD repeat-containing protein
MHGPRLRCVVIGVAVFAVFALGAAGARAQGGAAPSTVGFQPNRDYLALLPFESIDSASNNLIVTFTDLVLPGNDGRELRFERVFSNQSDVLANPGGPRWRFGIGGFPISVVERSLAERNQAIEPGILESERGTAPYFWMLDGSRVKTTYVMDPSPTYNRVVVQTPHFWRYNRDTFTLLMPDGTAAVYGALIGNTTERRLSSIVDPFGNTVSIGWAPNAMSVTQSVGADERVVWLTMNDATRLPTGMAYAPPNQPIRTWTYRYLTTGKAAQLDEVEFPLGLTWKFEYSTEMYSEGKLTLVRMPQGGEIEYSYADREFFVPGSQTPDVFNVMVERRTRDANQLVGTWTFTHLALSEQAFNQTTVTLPSGTKVSYTYGAWSPSEVVLAGGWELRFRHIQTPSGSTLEEEERQYGLLNASRSGVAWGILRLTSRIIKRAGQTYSTEYAYAASAPLVPGTFLTYQNHHRPTTITERGPEGTVRRSTALNYQHMATGTLFFGALPTREATTITGMTAEKTWAYNGATGFRESESLYGIATTFTPDADGNIATATKANGKATSFTYSFGEVKDTTTPQYVVSRVINPDGTIASETAAGRTTNYSYDARGRLTETLPPGESNAIIRQYDNLTFRSSTTNRGTSSVTTTTDGFGRPITTENSVHIKTRTEYDAEGRKTYQSYPFEGNFNGTTDIGTFVAYDFLGRVTVETNPDQTTRTRTYDDTTNSITVHDEESRGTVVRRYAFGHPDDARLSGVEDANQQEWAYSYDAIGNLAQVVAPTGETRTWLRNTNGLLTSETHPESGTVLYTQYDQAGVLKRMVDAKGTKFVYQHDGNDRVNQITAGTRVTNITYELGSDNRVAITDGSVSTSFDYDAAGLRSHRRDVIGPYVFDSQYTYDRNHQVIATIYPTGRVIGYERTGANETEGRITKVFETNPERNYAFDMRYHPSGALARYTAGNNIATTIGYDPDRYWVRSITSGALQLTYDQYDGVGNVGSIGDTRPGMTQGFTYDVLDRLWTSSSSGYPSATYAYDPHGNRQTASGTTYAYEAGTLRLSQQGSTTFGYDSNGNLTTASGTSGGTYTYTPENWLKTATGGGATTTYTYDADGWRTKKTAPGEMTFYLRGPTGELLTEWRNQMTSAVARDYVYAGSRLLSAIDRPMTPMAFTTCGGESIPDGAPTTLTIAAGATGTMTFEGSACRRVSAAVSAWTMGNCALIWHQFTILNPDGTPLATSSNLCAGGNGGIVGPVVLPTSGTYTVVVDPYGSYEGQITLAVYDVVDVTGPLTFGEAVNASLTTPGQRGVWTFSGSANQRVSTAIGASTMGNCALIWHKFTILNPDGTPLGSISNLCAGATVEPVVLPTVGVYTVVVDPYRSYTGQVAVTAYNVVDVTGPMTFGEAVNASLTTPGQRGMWTFSGSANQRVSAVINTSTVGLCPYIYHKFTILKPDGTPLGSISNLCTGTIIEPVVLPTGGTYTVVVYPSGSYTGEVTVTAYNVVDMTGSLTVNAAAVPVALMTPGQQAILTFSGTAGQLATVRLTGNTIGTTLVKLLKPDFSQLTSTSSAASSFNLTQQTLSPTGTYTVIVDPSAAKTGTISVQVTSP